MDGRIGLGARRYVRLSLGAMFGVLLPPVVIVLAVVASSSDSLTIALAVALAASVLGLTAFLGHALWSRNASSSLISFRELVLWGWLRRKRAEQRVAEHEQVLDLDAAGLPADDLVLSRDHGLAILRDLSAALETKDVYTHGHSKRVERHVLRTAALLGLDLEDVERLGHAAALHDIGKIRTPDAILRKPGDLSESERLALQDHVNVGARLVALVGSPDVVDGVLHHHERWDGSGYPGGLSGNDIPLFARIIAVADAYDAMTSTRPYRPSYSHEFAVDTLEREAGRQFDPAVVRAFVANLPERVSLPSLVLPAAWARPWRALNGWLHVPAAESITGAVAAASVVLMVGGPLGPAKANHVEAARSRRLPARVVVARPLMATADATGDRVKTSSRNASQKKGKGTRGAGRSAGAERGRGSGETAPVGGGAAPGAPGATEGAPAPDTAPGVVAESPPEEEGGGGSSDDSTSVGVDLGVPDLGGTGAKGTEAVGVDAQVEVGGDGPLGVSVEVEAEVDAGALLGGS